MAKRSRGAARPGQMRPAIRRPQQQRPAERGGAATTGVIRPAARPGIDDLGDELELVEERPVSAATERNHRDRERADSAATPRIRGAQPSGLLAARAAQEYGYVAKDIRHIGVVGGALLILLIVLWVLIKVVHVIPI